MDCANSRHISTGAKGSVPFHTDFQKVNTDAWTQPRSHREAPSLRPRARVGCQVTEIWCRNATLPCSRVPSPARPWECYKGTQWDRGREKLKPHRHEVSLRVKLGL